MTYDSKASPGQYKTSQFASQSASLYVAVASQSHKMMSLAVKLFCLIFLVCPLRSIPVDENESSTKTASTRQSNNTIVLNDRPIIGILSQELPKSLAKLKPGSTSYIAASYVKFIEGQGGRVVPIRLNQNEAYYRKMFNSINGLLFPGGSANLSTSQYAKIGSLFYKMAIESNDKGDFFPIFGICLGYELLAVLQSGKLEILTSCNSSDQALKLNFLPGAYSSDLYRDADKEILDALSNEPVTSHFHVFCLTMESFTSSTSLRDFYTISSTATGLDNITAVASLEAKRYPFSGVQFHPEKNMYEWQYASIPKTPHAIKVGQYFAEYFVNQARRNGHKFASAKEEADNLIFNHQPNFTGGNTGSSFVQCYIFD